MRILVFSLGANVASSTDLASVNISMPKNQTAAAMAVGEIAANAAAAAGASPEVVIQSAANRAGMDAAESAREQGMTQPQVEAAAAHEAEEAAKSAGATPDEAATAAGNLAVEVTKQDPTTGMTGIATSDAWSMVPGTDCLNWWGDGCQSITTEAACLSSRSGNEIAIQLGGKKSFGQPCVWCAGKQCLANSTLASVCAPRSMLPDILPPGFSAATCSGNSAATRETASKLWQQSVPDELRGGGYPRRDLNFEPVFNAGDAKEGGHACRHKSIEDASNLDPFSRNYYATWTADLKECLDICSWKQDCTGIEHSETNNYCEVWNVPIEWVAPLDGYTCFRAMPATSNVSAGTVRWRAGDTMAVEERVGSPVPSFFWVIGGLVVIALVVAICVVWRSRKRRKKDQKATKRSVKTDDNLEQNGSGDEMQPLVAPFGTPTNASSTPSFAGSFSGLGAGPGQSKTTPFGAYSGYGGHGYGSDAGCSGYSYGCEAVGGAQGPQVGDSNYLQQLRQWLQQYEAARFQELAQLQSSAPQAGWGQTPAWAG